MSQNKCLLHDLAQTKIFLHKVEKSKLLQELNLSGCISGFNHVTRPIADATTAMMVDDVLQVNTTLTKVNLAIHFPPTEHDRGNQRRIEPWTRRNIRLAKVLAGVQGLQLLQNHHHTNNTRQQNGNEENPIIIAGEGSWRFVLKAALEDVGRDRSALYLLIRKAIVGGHDHEGDEACPLHEKVVDFLKLASKNNTNNNNDNNIGNSGCEGGGGKRARLS